MIRAASLVIALCTFGTLSTLGTLGTLGTESTVRTLGTVRTVRTLAFEAPARFEVLLETTKGAIRIECLRAWAPHGADRFYELVTTGYYDDSAFFRIRAKTWAQFGINGQPEVSKVWRTKTISDDPFMQPNVRGTVAFAFAVPNGRATQVFINLADNRASHDKEPFVPFGRVTQGMDVADSFYSAYGEESGSGIRAGKQAPLFEQGNAYLKKHFPKLDYIKTARIN